MKPRLVKSLANNDWVIVCGNYCLAVDTFSVGCYILSNWSDLAYILGAYLYEQRQEKAAGRDAPRAKHGYN